MCDQDARVRRVTRNESGLRDEENILQWLAQVDVDGHLTQPVELIGVSIANGVRQQQARRRRLIRTLLRTLLLCGRNRGNAGGYRR